jgi:hypothetical protein
MNYSIRNWREFQHFKDRRPPWIKVHHSLLDKRVWHELDGNDAKLLIMLWLIASEDDQLRGRLPSTGDLAFRLRMPEPEVEQLLIRLSYWLGRDDDDTISSQYHDDITPKRRVRRRDTASEVQRRDREETETETETETEKESAATAAPADAAPSPGREERAQAPTPREPPPRPPQTSRRVAPREGVAEKKGGKISGSLCPDDFRPSREHYAAGSELGLTPSEVDNICSRMHDWSHANANRDVAKKADWSLTLFNFIRTNNSNAKKPRGTIRGGII